MVCEKCWIDAYFKAQATGEGQSTEYFNLLEERKDNPCSAKERAGQYWDEEKHRDSRTRGLEIKGDNND